MKKIKISELMNGYVDEELQPRDWCAPGWAGDVYRSGGCCW